ncbi:acetyltransferase [Candidatus Albibeggiatoa sp. nov. NOAA]|uniref:acetyltransferase n=1 Tax=Candidatus Albibeggiatoa sp. nov. NOAA TaxID=3162724 RepID=UPI00330514D5|nr:acetyltransferase [Thiotrichaceae bacterium]
MAKVIIFGTLDTAQLAYYYLSCDSEHEVIGFTVSQDYLQTSTFCELPVVGFETIEHIYPPNEYDFFIPMTGRKMNQLREQIYLQVKAKGYQCISYISSKATVLTENIGDNCFILENCTVQPFVTIGNDVMIWADSFVGHHSTVHSHTFIATATMAGHSVIEPYCYIGLKSVINNHCHVAEGTFLAANSLLTQNSKPWHVYQGSPAKMRNIDSRRYYQ